MFGKKAWLYGSVEPIRFPSPFQSEEQSQGEGQASSGTFHQSVHDLNAMADELYDPHYDHHGILFPSSRSPHVTGSDDWVHPGFALQLDLLNAPGGSSNTQPANAQPDSNPFHFSYLERCPANVRHIINEFTDRSKSEEADRKSIRFWGSLSISILMTSFYVPV